MTVEASINYIGTMAERARYYAQDHTRDNLIFDARSVHIEDLRSSADPPSLEREGFALVPHKSAIADFRNADDVRRVHPGEIERLLLELTSADRVVVTGTGILRFAERSPDCGRLFNSYPARFIHIDISDPTAKSFAERSQPEEHVRRFAHYNVWRAVSSPPQDVPLAVCDARSLSPSDLVEADAVFDAPGAAEWSFEGLVIRYNPAHRWCYFSRMNRDEALVFKTNDSDLSQPHHIAHTAFDDPTCPPGVVPRASIEMRAIAYWL